MSTPILDILMKLRNPLVHLPCCPTILQYDPGQIIYSPRDPATSFYLIIRGIVKIAETSPDGRQVILDVYTDEEFFGETALLNVPTRRNQASTMQETTLLAWGVQEFHGSAAYPARPQLCTASNLRAAVERIAEAFDLARSG